MKNLFFKLCLITTALLAAGCAQSLTRAKTHMLVNLMGPAALVDSPSLTEAQVVRQLAEWMAQVHHAVDDKWVLLLPVNTPLDLSATVRLKLTPDGRLLKAGIQTSSGYADFDQSLLRAVRAAEAPPFPSRQAYEYAAGKGGVSITFVR